MTRQMRHVLLCLGVWIGLAIIGLAGVLVIPQLIEERVSLQRAQESVQEQRGVLDVTRKRCLDLELMRQKLESQLASYQQELDQARFPPIFESRMPDFLELLEKTCGEKGLRLVDLLYRERRLDRLFLTLPFEVRVEGEYTALRKLIANFETWPAPLRIEELEFISPIDSRGVMQWRFSGTARFMRGG